jgi:hypothetical protein
VHSTKKKVATFHVAVRWAFLFPARVAHLGANDAFHTAKPKNEKKRLASRKKDARTVIQASKISQLQNRSVLSSKIGDYDRVILTFAAFVLFS